MPEFTAAQTIGWIIVAAMASPVALIAVDWFADQLIGWVDSQVADGMNRPQTFVERRS